MTTNPIDLQPHLIGDLVELRPLRPGDWDALFAVASDPLIWEQHPASDRYKEEVFRDFFQDAIDSKGAFAIVDRTTGDIIGSSRYHGYDPAKSEIEIGWTFFARAYWGGRYNGETKRLMLDHAFSFAESVILCVGVDNMRSRKAVERIGGVLSGSIQKTDRRGNVFDHVIYRVGREK